MLAAIDKFPDDALMLLTWLAYARSPPNLGELTEALVIKFEEDVVDSVDRGSPEDILDILGWAGHDRWGGSG